ncbi:DUF1989 domain-containing protein [uncultured Roseobacter sp.]|uniref:DUF1989 domain-containing protein n=1 Tax=uncultured Roseobacter sp. TaxID=114847 RepID=UPI0026178961|nr:aminomethyltransferase family protein [uncultured Roseobacter sp.]
MSDHSIIHAFSNVGKLSGGRHFPGFPLAAGKRSYLVGPRNLQRINVKTGDLLSLDLTGGDGVSVAAFDDTGADASAALGLAGADIRSTDVTQTAELVAWIASQGGRLNGHIHCTDVPPQPEPVVLKCTAPCSVWILHAAEADALVSGEGGGTVHVSHQSAGAGALMLPEPLGEIREEFTVPRASAIGYEVRRGEVLQIIDAEGQQCSDFQAFRAASLDIGREHMIDATATRSMVRRAFPGPGLADKFFDQNMVPMLKVIQDTCGRHDTFGLACTARGYEERGFPGHVNCSDNISHALEQFGVEKRTAWPAINFFWNTWIDPHHHLMTEESYSRPGDYVAMEAMDDLVCVTTACPDDIDPINGWNPTDVHVRIYRPESRIQRAVAYRPKEDAPMLISRESAFHPRLAPQTEHFAPARDLWTPVSFPAHGTLGEYWACRDAVSLQDMSGLRKFDIIGPDAERLMQSALTRDISRLAVWRGTYALICDESGEVIDDGTLFRLGQQLFRWCCGSEESGRWLTRMAREAGYQVRVHDLRNSLPNLALQGPRSRSLLEKLVFTQPNVPGLEHLRWFGATIARLNDRDGAPFLLTRTGYTGELGFEIFCAESDALTIWDALTDAGQAFGLKPMGSAALEMLRVEAGLAAAGAEFAPGVDALEAGLGFAVDFRKQQFCGRAALERNAKDPRRSLRGLIFDCDDVPAAGCPVFNGERQVGVITSATRSPLLQTSVAMARLAVEHAGTGTVLEVGQLDGHMKRLTATVADVPFVDPERKKPRA